MNLSELYVQLYQKITEWKHEIEEEVDPAFKNKEDSVFNEISKMTDNDEKVMSLVVKYAVAREDYVNEVYRTLADKLLNLGVKIGMDLQEKLDGIKEN